MNNALKKYSNFEACFNNVNEIFSDFKPQVRNYENQKERYIILPPKNKDKKSLLLVAHLDTVQTPVINSQDSMAYYGAGFDCRTGFYLALKAYNELANITVLLTDNEEIGATTAKFALEEINTMNLAYMIELDRALSDYVTYQFESKKLAEIMAKIGIVEGFGSYSDICALYDTGLTAINIGIGYDKAHSKKSTQSKLALTSTFNVLKTLSALNDSEQQTYYDDTFETDKEYTEETAEYRENWGYMTKKEKAFYNNDYSIFEAESIQDALYISNFYNEQEDDTKENYDHYANKDKYSYSNDLDINYKF